MGLIKILSGCKAQLSTPLGVKRTASEVKMEKIGGFGSNLASREGHKRSLGTSKEAKVLNVWRNIFEKVWKI